MPSSGGCAPSPVAARSSRRRREPGRYALAMRLVVVAAPPWGGPEAGAPMAALADLVEWRLDLLPDADPAGGMATLRSRGEGGAFDGTPEEAARRLLAALREGATVLDAEAGVVPLVAAEAARRGAFVLASTHGTGPVRLAREGVNAWKVARPVEDGPSMRAAIEE